MAAVVDALVVSVLLQISVGHVCPSLAPLYKLFLAVPTLGNGILSAELGAFRVLVGSFISVFLRFGWRHIHLFSPDLVRILLLPSVSLCRLELGGGKAPFFTVSDTEIFLFCLVLPVALFIKGAHRQHNMGVRVMTGRMRIVDSNVSAHPLGNKTALNEIG